MKIQPKWYVLVVLGLVSLTMSGCGNTSVFKNLSGGGAATEGLAAASQSLNNGNYTAAIDQATAVIDSPQTSTENKVTAYAVKGQAILGKNNVTLVNFAASIGDKSTVGTQNVFALLQLMDLDQAILAANCLNTANILANTLQSVSIPERKTITVASSDLTRDQNMARLMANLLVCSKMLSYVFTITDTGLIVNSPFALFDCLDYLFPSSSRGLVYYANVVEATAPYTGLSGANLASVTKCATFVRNFKAINDARKGGDPFSYNDGSPKTINSHSTTANVQAAIDYQATLTR